MAQTMILTGCASGIAKHLSSVLYDKGHRLVLTDISADGLAEAVRAQGIADDRRVVTRRLDVRDAAAWDGIVGETVERFGRVDVVLNVAGCLSAVWAVDATPEQVDLMIDVNTKGMMYGTNAALRQMVAQGAGHVLNVASMAALVPVPGLAIYSASKHAARAYSIAVGQEVRKYGVFVTAVCPTVVKTPMMDIQLDREEAAFTFSGRRPLTVEEVSHAIVHDALIRKPLELVLDAGSGQGIVSKVGNLFPELFLVLGDSVQKIGKRRQARLQAKP